VGFEFDNTGAGTTAALVLADRAVAVVARLGVAIYKLVWR
jgi:hypothetical protein